MIYLHEYDFKTDTKVLSRKKLLENLSHYLRKSPQEIKIYYNENGKPYVNNLFFSVSHCRNKVVQVFSSQAEIGIDLEFRNPKRAYLALAKRYFHSSESKQLEQLVEQDAMALFYNLWCAKEAVCKAKGGRLWYYLADNYLAHDMKIIPEFKGILVKCLDKIPDFSLCLASTSQLETITHV